jgi:hypothetical protein
MDKTKSENQNELNKELEGTVFLKTIRKGQLLQAPEGYFDRLNPNILERIENRQTRVTIAPSFSVSPFFRWAGIGAAALLVAFIWYYSLDGSRIETAQESKPTQVESVEVLNYALLESTDIHAIEEHVLAEELISIPQVSPTDSSIEHDQLTEYIVLHADHDLLIESL